MGEELDYAAGLFSAGALTEELVQRLELSKIMDTHPYDLSGGELQIFALARLLMTDPKVILLDEPVKGLDPDSRTKVGQLIRELAAEGRSVLMVTHDLEFAAEYSDRCAMLFDGALQGQLTTGELFTRNEFYTTPAARICRGHFQGVYTVAQAQRIIKEQDSAD
ncbi:MAG: AAA family ATPase [Ruminococcus sp.]|nr:AAA family ATPase [Ruminococcus sp.]